MKLIALQPLAPPLPANAAETVFRWFPGSAAGRIAAVLTLVLVAGYVVATGAWRLQGMLAPWSADGDQAQAVWHYWRYHLTGAFPPGDLLVDYAFAMHAPPAWWVMMASLSTVLEPLTVAKFWNVVAYLGTGVVMLLAVWRRSNVFVGGAAVVLLMRNVDFYAITAGGYARSYGPMLVLAFVGLFLAQRHRAVLALLVFQAALYPSVVMPCGLAYGLYVVVKGPMPLRLRRMAGMLVAGLLIIALGKSQEFQSHDWWGPLVTETEAEAMPAWHAGGRVAELPQKPWRSEIERNFSRAFRTAGSRVTIAPVERYPIAAVLVGGAVACACVSWAVRRRINRRGAVRSEPAEPVPWQLLLLCGTMLFSYFAARALFFKLYLPYRPLQHVFPYIIYSGLPLFAWVMFSNIWPGRAVRNTVCTLLYALVPCLVFLGVGNDRGPTSYISYAQEAPMYEAVRALPQDALIAGDLYHMSTIPLFAHHKVYINKNLTHPFRKGYYDECERRISAMYHALYAVSFDEVVKFGRAEHVDYLIYRVKGLSIPDKRMFNPLTRPLAALQKRNKGKMVLAAPPASSIVWRHGDELLISIDLLEKALADPATTAPPFIGPSPQPPPPTLGPVVAPPRAVEKPKP